MIVVVSGLPRSGTSMMMQILEAGGFPILTDELRKADASNPKGYYEFEPVKQMMQGNLQWLPQAEGKAVKIISPLLFYLPKEFSYRIIFMQRDLDEVLRSQKKMLEQNKKSGQQASDQEMKQFFEDHQRKVTAWLAGQSNIDTLYLRYYDVVIQPKSAVENINRFLNKMLNTQKMMEAIDLGLYSKKA